MKATRSMGRQMDFLHGPILKPLLIFAGHTAARKLYGFFTMPFGALAQSVSTFVAQNRGPVSGTGSRCCPASRSWW